MAVTVPTAAPAAASRLTVNSTVSTTVGGVQAAVSVVKTADGSPHAIAYVVPLP